MTTASVEWIGTYTAYNGSLIQSELLRTRDFRAFDLVPMTGPAARNKGMALFPRKVGGQYMMIGRQDGENLFLLKSDELTHWEEGAKILDAAIIRGSWSRSAIAARRSSSTRAGCC